MSGGGGSMQNMIVTLRNNRNLLKNISLFKNKDKVRHTKHQELVFKKPKEQELKAFRIKLKEENKRQRLKKAIVFLISVMMAVFIMSLFYNYFSNPY